MAFIQIFLAFIAVIVVIAIIIAVLYNKLVAARNAFRNAFSQIDVQLTRRYDLIPNLVESVKAYLKHEHETFAQVAEARSQAISGLKEVAQHPGNPDLMSKFSIADTALNSALGRLMAVVEAYPELKASDNIKQFNEELASTENRVAFARQTYNDEVMSFNTLAEQFPSNIVAQTFGFQLAAFWQGDDKKKDAPRVDFS